MLRRFLAILLVVVLGWTGMASSESGMDAHQDTAVHLGEGGIEAAGDREGTVNDHHLDDMGASAHDLPDQHREGRPLVALEELTSPSPTGLIGELCSPDMPVPQRPPCNRA